MSLCQTKMIILETKHIWKKQQVPLSHLLFSPFIPALQAFYFMSDELNNNVKHEGV